MPLTGGDIAQRAADDYTPGDVRAQPQRLRWTIPDLATNDNHRLTCTFACSVAAVDRPADRQMLAETFLAKGDTIGSAEIASDFQSAIATAAAQAAGGRSAEQWLAAGADAAMIEALRAAGQTVAFGCGLELLPPYQVQIASPTVDRLRLETLERQLVERRSAGQLEHFNRAAELLKSFDAMRAASPSLSVGRVLDAVSDADRGATLQTLLMAAAPKAAATLWAVGGMGLARIEQGGAAQSFALPSEVGPPRSVRSAEWDDQPVWLIGCRSGVLIVSALDQRTLVTLHDRDVASARGFGGAVLRDGVVTATHSEGGIVRWRVDQPDAPTWVQRPIDGEEPRNLCALDGSRVAYTSRGTLMTLDGDARESIDGESSHPVVSLLALDHDLFIVHADGEVVRKDRTTLETHSRARHCGTVRTAALLPWIAGVRLLLATEDGPVCCVGSEDSLVTQYVSSHRGLQALAATNGLIAGVTADRQRIVLWNAWDGRSPVAEINVTARTRHRVADIAFAHV